MGIKVDNLLPRKRFVVSYVFEVKLHDLERLSAIPVNGLSLFFTTAAETWGAGKPAAVAAEYGGSCRMEQ